MKKNLLYAFAAGSILLGASATAAVYSAQESKAADTVTIADFVPATGSEVKSISTVTVRFEVGEVMYNSDDSKVAEITLTKQGSSESISATSFGEPTMSMDGMYFEYPVNFATPVTEAGTYTLSIPEGIFFETEYDATKDAFVKKEGGIVNAAATATYVVNPTAEVTNSFSKYLLTPESGSSVKEIEMVQLTFENFGAYDAFYNAVEGKEISFTNGSIDYKAYASQDFGYEDGKRFNIFPMDAQENPVTITEAGEWYLYLQEGAFSYNGEESPEIMASYIVGDAVSSSLDNYVFSPASGETVGKLSTILMTFPEFKIFDELYRADDSENATITNGTKTYTVNIAPNYDNYAGENSPKEFDLTFVDGNEEKVITEDGTWTLTIPAGYFETTGAKSNLITATYTIDSSIKTEIKWSADPANGGTSEFPAGQVLTVTFTFDNAKSVSYDQANEDEVAGIRVSYNGTTIKEVANALGTEEANNGWQLYQNYGDNCAILRLNYQIFNNTPGILAIEIDGGRFTVDGMPSPAINYTCSFGDYKEYTYNLLPSSSEPQTDLRVFTISFPEAERASVNEALFYATFGNAAWACPGNPVVKEVTGAEHPTFTITFSDNPQKPGTYTLMIDEGSFLLDGKQPSSMIKENYTFAKNEPVDWTWEAAPTGDIIIEEWGIFPSFKFTDDENLSVLPAFRNGSIVVLNDVTLSTNQYSTGMSSDNNAVYFEITDPALLKPGKLTITIPAGAISLRNETNKEPISHTWNVVMPKTYSFTLNPDGGVDSASAVSVYDLSKITLSIPEAASSEVFMESGVSLRASDYSYYGTAKIAKSENAADACEYTFTFDPAPTTKGIYQLSIRFDTFTLDGSQGWPSDWTNIDRFYKFDKGTGISDINAENGNVTVVSVDGKVILKDAPASELKNLAKGIYIINGKKQIIK